MARRRSAAFYVGVWVAVAAFSVACVFLGRWQWHRHETRSAANRVTVANYDAAAVPLDSVLPIPDAAAIPALSWKVVSAQGRYDAGATVLVRGRVEDGSGAYLVMTPLVQNDGTALWVNRGWIVMPDDAGAPGHLPAPPADSVTVTGHLRPAEPDRQREAPAGQVYSITPPVLAAAGGLSAPQVQSYYLEATAEVPPAAQTLGAYERPDIDDGPHLSYALQWWLFAALAPVIAAVVLRRTRGAQASAPRRTASGTAAAWHSWQARVLRNADGRDEADEDAEASQTAAAPPPPERQASSTSSR